MKHRIGQRWPLLLALLAGLLLAGYRIAGIRAPSGIEDAAPRLATTNRVEGAALCPWREPASDLAALFPGATNARSEIRILSGKRLDLAKQLGRPPQPDENSLHVHEILRDGHPAGLVLIRRVKAEHGAIELVVGVRPDGAISGIRIQRSREPHTIAALLESEAFLGMFRGCRGGESLPSEGGLARLPAEARPSASAILDGVRSLLILLSLSTAADIPRSPIPEWVIPGHAP